MNNTKQLKTYDLVTSANDGLATVQAASKKAAMEIWKTKLWTRHPQAKGVRAIEVK